MTLTPEAQAANLNMNVLLPHPYGRGPVALLDLNAFTDPVQMTTWEYAAYDAYGNVACERDGINTLADLFGPEWVKPWNRRRNLLLARTVLPEAEKEFAEAKARLALILATIMNPPDYFPYFQPSEATDV